MSEIDTTFLYSVMLKGLMTDKQYAVSVVSVFEKEFFEDNGMSDAFSFIQSHVKEYNALPSKDIIINSIDKGDKRDTVQNLLNIAENTEFDIAENYDWLNRESNKYLKDRAIKQAILKSVDIIDGGKPLDSIRKVVESALSKDLEISLGLNYFDEMKERLTRIFTASDNRVRTYYPTLDELFNGGYPPYTLNMMIAKVHGHKTNIMTNIIARQVKNGVRVALATLEMSEDMYAQRFDANFSNLDINRIYHNKTVKKQFIKNIQEAKEESTGDLWIKEYPTGRATVADFRRWLRELKIRGIEIDILFCDYISLMKAESNHLGDLYKDGKAISEELRALGFEFNIPVVTVAQINRTGTFLDFETLDMNSIGESFGIPATADSLLIQGADPDDMMYKSELKWKSAKNRLGGRVGTTGRWYFDEKSLRIYDETEFDLWMSDSASTGDGRDLYERDND